MRFAERVPPRLVSQPCPSSTPATPRWPASPRKTSLRLSRNEESTDAAAAAGGRTPRSSSSAPDLQSSAAAVGRRDSSISSTTSSAEVVDPGSGSLGDAAETGREGGPLMCPAGSRFDTPDSAAGGEPATHSASCLLRVASSVRPSEVGKIDRMGREVSCHQSVTVDPVSPRSEVSDAPTILGTRISSETFGTSLCASGESIGRVSARTTKLATVLRGVMNVAKPAKNVMAAVSRPFYGTELDDPEVRMSRFVRHGQSIADDMFLRRSSSRVSELKNCTEVPPERQFAWMVALVFKHEEELAYDTSISKEHAKHIFLHCFKGCDARRGCSAPQLLQDMEAFLKRFDELPDADISRVTRLSLAVRFSSSGARKRHRDFIRLMRECITERLFMRCCLRTMVMNSSDERYTFVLATCSKHELLVEADRQQLPLELDLRVCDPVSLEPCTRNFFPLLHWFFIYSPVDESDELYIAYQRVLLKITSERQSVKDHFAEEIIFWEWPMKVFSTRHKAKYGHANEVHLPHYNAKREAGLKELFLMYLQLKAMRGLRTHPDDLREEVNFEGSRQYGCALETLYEVLQVPACGPFFSFDVGGYLGENAKPHCWRCFQALSLRSNSFISVPFSQTQRATLIKTLLETEIDLDRLRFHGILEAAFPLDCREKLFDSNGCTSELYRAWAVPHSDWHGLGATAAHILGGVLTPAAISSIRSYYGEAVACYFGFAVALGRSLSWLSCVGLVVGILEYVIPDDSQYYPLVATAYSFAIVAWSSGFVAWWVVEDHHQDILWGTNSFDRPDNRRPTFKGFRQRSPITYDDYDSVFPGGIYSWTFGQLGRAPRILLSFCAMAMLSAMQLVIATFLCDIRNRWLTEKWTLHEYAMPITVLVLAVELAVVSSLALQISMRLNIFENHRTKQDFEDYFLLKMFATDFINRHSVCFYVAFLKAFRVGCVEDNDGRVSQPLASFDEGTLCYYELRVQIAYNLGLEFMWNAVEILAPLLLPKLAHMFSPMQHEAQGNAASVDESARRIWMSYIIESEMNKTPYVTADEIDGLFNEYLELMYLFGQVSLFSVVCPLSTIFCQLMLVLEVRLDGFKVFHVHQRAFPRRSGTIGSWKSILLLLSFLAVLSNSILLVFTMQVNFLDNRFFTFVVVLLCYLAVCVTTKLALTKRADNRDKLYAHHHVVVTRHAQEDATLLRRKVDPSKLRLQPEASDEGESYEPEMYGLIGQQIFGDTYIEDCVGRHHGQRRGA
eukprot:TRINITY_DN21221_c0_g2_i1.p1 TRINITY_DN21221_c0_g2~~TRINITY_DN21221_c0_g2_i1.p1  ORF type:complete len:1244 (-),score=162.37 TRINITY_DN21221_c0_g2_i1:418-4149(-)